MTLLSEQNLLDIKKSQRHSLCAFIAFLFLMVLDLVLVFVLQTRETRVVFTLAGTLLFALSFLGADMVFFLYYLPYRRLMKFLLKAKSSRYPEQETGVVEEIQEETTFEFLPYRHVCVRVSEDIVRSYLLLSSMEDPKVGESYSFVIVDNRIISYQEVQDETASE